MSNLYISAIQNDAVLMTQQEVSIPQEGSSVDQQNPTVNNPQNVAKIQEVETTCGSQLVTGLNVMLYSAEVSM